jgi:hypothetical protein
MKIDELVKSRFIPFPVIPAEAGIQSFQAVLDPGVRRGDGFGYLLRARQNCLPPKHPFQPSEFHLLFFSPPSEFSPQPSAFYLTP